MSQFVLVRHKVRDFNVWKAGFDALAPMRAAAVLSNKQLLRRADDADEVVIVLEVKDLERARAFIASPGLRETMQPFGIVDKPDIYFLKE